MSCLRLGLLSNNFYQFMTSLVYFVPFCTQEFLTFNSMMNEHLRKFGHVKAMERSIHSARLSFVETLHREGKMSDPEYAILDDWYRFLTNQELPRHPSGFDTDADLIDITI